MLGLSYWFLPLFAGCVWLGTLLGMLGYWISQGSPNYPWESPGEHLAYISDIGATAVGTDIFIPGSTVCVVVFDIAFISERWLRHKGRLTHNYRTSEKILSGFAILFAVIGAAGLITLTICNTRHYHTVHDTMLCVFIAGYIISAIFICAEYQRLGIHYREHRILRISFWIKLAFIFVEIALVVAFGVMSYQHRYTRAAYLEWIISLFFIFYVWSFIIDFLPAVRTKHKADRFPPSTYRSGGEDEMAMNTQEQPNMLGGPAYINGGYGGGYGANDSSSHDSQRPMAETDRYYTPQGVQPPSRNF